MQFAKKIGPIFSVKMYGPRVAIFNGHKLVREAYQSDNFTDRPVIPIFADTVGEKGDFFSNSAESGKQLTP